MKIVALFLMAVALVIIVLAILNFLISLAQTWTVEAVNHWSEAWEYVADYAAGQSVFRLTRGMIIR